MNVSGIKTWRRCSAGRLQILLGLAVLNVCLVALARAQDQNAVPSDQTDVVITQIDGPDDVAADAERFEALDVFVDSGSNLLAAYQFELVSKSEGVEIAGIEGGEHAAFQAAPYYDPRAMQSNRIILAAFSTDENVPSGRTRVVRIHLQLQGPGQKEYQTKLVASATADGTEIPATISIQKATKQ